jgi:hypothetical protein
MKTERRIFRTEFRDVKGAPRQKWATAVTYNTVDDYGSLWTPGVFDEALDERMPTLLYGHDWGNLTHVLGKGIDKRTTPETDGPAGVDVLVEFADVEAADLALKLLGEKVLRDVSVGFERREWREGDKLTKDERALGATEAMDKAGMDELSIVVRGAVPGAQMRTARRGAKVVDLDAVVEIAKRKAAGELTDAEASAALDLLAGVETSGEAPAAPADAAAADEAAIEALHAEGDAALALIGRSRR